MARFNNILDTVGNTPLVRLSHLAPEGVNLYVKVESFNPMGSVKDRMAKAMIEQAERSGELKPGQTVIEATSGNTGIGLAMVCAQKGYPLVVTMAESNSVERRKLLRFLGAKVVLTPAAQKGTGMLDKATELAEAHGYYLCRQFENEVNADIHTTTTAQEIIRDMDADSIHYFVSGFGTGGTLKGVARGLKQFDPSIKVVVAEPDNAQLLGSGIAQTRDESGKPSASHPNFRPHLMQGWSPDFVSTLTEDAMRDGYVDEILPVSGTDAVQVSRDLARREGIFAGITSGATVAVGLALAARSKPGTNIVCMLPDTGERYLSTPLFEGIGEDMTEEEIVLSNSTPGNRFGVASCPVTKVAADVDPAVREEVERLIAAEPVVLFALEWCEFCWSVRKLFAELNIEYKSVDLDSVAYQAEDKGARIRAVLAEKLGSETIPQIFIAGEHIGGCTELLDAGRDGSLAQRFERAGINFTASDRDPYEFYPKWVQPHTNVA